MTLERKRLDILLVNSNDEKPVRPWTFDGMLLMEQDTGNLFQLRQGAWVEIAGSGGGGGLVDSVFGRTGDVVAQTGDYNTTLVTEGTNFYHTPARAKAAVDKAHVDSLGANAATLGGLASTSFGRLAVNQTWTGRNKYQNETLHIDKGDVTIYAGPTNKLPTFGFNDSVYVALDRLNNINDCSFLFLTDGAVMAEFGLISDDDFHIKTVTGPAGGETFTDKIILRNQAEGFVDLITNSRTFNVTAVPRHIIGNSNGTTSGAGLELEYDQPNTLARIRSIERGNTFRRLNLEANGFEFFSGGGFISPVAAISHLGSSFNTGVTFMQNVDVNGRIRQLTLTTPSDGNDTVTTKSYVDSQFVIAQAEPSAPASGARLYVDSTSGDLKVKFANGTVKTLATN